MTNFEVTTGQDALITAAEKLKTGTGPIAIDVERASGYRYSQRAYLIQIFREGSGVFLIDPITVTDFAPLIESIENLEWIFHAASQDLPSLRELGLIPNHIFDTELAARLLGYERVGLQTVLEITLDVKLEKAHSSADWSTRPLPQDWLKYAADDVLYLIAVKNILSKELEESGKSKIAEQEFQSTLTRLPKPPMEQPWRRLSGLHTLRSTRQLAVARELWLARESLARETDIAPGRLVPDKSLLAAAAANPSSKQTLAGMKDFNGRASRTEIDRWWQAIKTGQETTDLPERKGPSQSPSHPPVKAWSDRNPLAAKRLDIAKTLLQSRADELKIPLENLLTPQLLRTLCWDLTESASAEDIDSGLAQLGARQWQTEICVPLLITAFTQAHAEAAD